MALSMTKDYYDSLLSVDLLSRRMSTEEDSTYRTIVGKLLFHYGCVHYDHTYKMQPKNTGVVLQFASVTIARKAKLYDMGTTVNDVIYVRNFLKELNFTSREITTDDR
eukprot:4047958-Amphidinium_carterae.3